MRAFRFSLSVLVVAFVLFVCFDSHAAPKKDLNKEFADRFYQLKSDSADANLKVNRHSPGTKVDSLKKQESGSTVSGSKPDNEGDGISVSTLGKLLQLTLVVLLAAIIFILSRRSKRKGRY